MMAFAPPHKEHNSILTRGTSSFVVHPTSKSFQIMDNNKKDDLHSSRPGVFSPPPRPVRSNVRPAAEIKAARAKAECDSMTFNIDEEQVDEAIEEEEDDDDDDDEEEEEEEEEEEYYDEMNANRSHWTERSMSLDEAKAKEQQRSISNSLRTNRPRLDSAPTSGVTGFHYRSRSHFSIPDIAITSADEEGNEVRYELQLEQAKRRLVLDPSLRSKSNFALEEKEEDNKQQAKAPATTKAKAQLAMFTFPTSSSSSSSAGISGGKKKSNKTTNRSRIPPLIHIVNTEGQSRILEASEAAKYPLPISPTSPSSSSSSSSQGDALQDHHFITKEQVNESGSAPVISNTTMTSKIGKRLRKSSLPNLFGKKERDAANAAATQNMPNEGTIESPLQSPTDTTRQHVFVARQSSDPVSVNDNLSSFGNVNGEDHKSHQYIVGNSLISHSNHAEVPISPTLSQVPSSPTSTMGRPSSTTSLTKKEVRQRQKEERNLIKELEKVDKMVRKHDEKAIKAQKKAEEKKRKEDKKQKKDFVNQRQISSPIAVSVIPTSQAIQHSSIPIQAAPITTITTPSPLEEIRNSSFERQSFPKVTQTEQNSIQPLFIEPKSAQITRDIKKKEKKQQSLDSVNTEPTYQDEDTNTLEEENVTTLPQLSKVAPRISLLPNTGASLSLFDSLYKEVDAMESSFGMQYPVEAQERRKSVASSSAPQSPKFL